MFLALYIACAVRGTYIGMSSASVKLKTNFGVAMRLLHQWMSIFGVAGIVITLVNFLYF